MVVAVMMRSSKAGSRQCAGCNLESLSRLSASDRLIAAYNRRVDRPGEPELRIFPKYDDPELLKVGNPYLRPQFTDAIEAGYGRSLAGGSINAALYHRAIRDAFSRVFAIDNSNPNYDIVNRLYQNAGNSRQTGRAAPELQANYIYYAQRNVPQGRDRARSSVDVSVKKPFMNERVELLFAFTDIFNDFAVQREVDGVGFTALYQNFLETQVATVSLRLRF